MKWKRESLPGSAALVALVALVASGAQLQTKPHGIQLPNAVDNTFTTKFPQAEIHKVDVEDENGVTVYDFEFLQAKAEKETDIAADGTMLEFTVVIQADAVPAAAMKTVREAAQGAEIGRIEHIEIGFETREGKIVELPAPATQFAVEMAKGGRKTEIVVTPDGTVIEPPRWGSSEVERSKDEDDE